MKIGDKVVLSAFDGYAHYRVEDFEPSDSIAGGFVLLVSEGDDLDNYTSPLIGERCWVSAANVRDHLEREKRWRNAYTNQGR